MSKLKHNVNFHNLAEEIINQLNTVRINPKSYIEKLENALKHFRGNVLSLHGEEQIETTEGKSAYEDAIEFLKRQKPVSELKADERLNCACRDHVNDIGPKGIASHDGSDGSSLSDRIEKYCEWDRGCCENLELGTFQAENIIMNFIVDDGIIERSHRKNIFNTDIEYIGVACGDHKEWEIITVVNFANSLREFGEPSPDIKNFISDYMKKSEEQKLNPKKEKNPFQENDADAPDDTVSLKLIKTTKIVKGKPKKILKKIYTLKDETQHIVEIEEN
jgi:uncharacterized protein YkwD